MKPETERAFLQILRIPLILCALFAFCVYWSGGTLLFTYRGYIGLGFAMLIGLAASQATILKSFVGRLVDLILNIFVSLSVGLILVMATNKEAARNKVSSEEIEEILIAATIVFAVTLVGRASTLIEEADEKSKAQSKEHQSAIQQHNQANIKLGEQVSDLKNYADDAKALQATLHRATDAIEEARFAGLASRVLEVQEEALRRGLGGQGGQHDVGIVNGVEQGIEALRAWIHTGDRIRAAYFAKQPDDDKGFGGTNWPDAARQAWWRTMQVYQKEEVYDVSRQELATNIRNYAFILLAVISEFLHRVKAENRKPSNRTHRLRLVVANVSGFAPKDFYNYPDGIKGNRFYHEAEFFGTYRRALAQVVSDPHVHPMRIVLAAPNGVGSSDSDPGQHNALGWVFDEVEKLMFDCARLRFIPWPITDRTQWAGEDTEDFERTATPSKESMGIEFRSGRDPAKRMPARAERYLYAPTFVEFAGYSHLGNEWAKNAALSEPNYAVSFRTEIANASSTLPKRSTGRTFSSGQTRLEQFEASLSAITSAYFDPSSRRSLSYRSNEAMLELLNAFSSSCGLIPEWSKTFGDWITYGLGQWPKGEVDHQKFADYVESRGLGEAGGVVGRAEERQIVVRCLASLVKVRAYSDRLRDESSLSERTDLLLTLFEECQKIDALVRLLGVRSGSISPGVIGSTGVELGLAEDWLHRTLVHHEGLECQRRHSGRPIPLWRLLMSDLCGLKDDLPDSSLTAEALTQALLPRLRIAIIGAESGDNGKQEKLQPHDGSANATTDSSHGSGPITEQEMLKENILAEFLMVGVVDESDVKEEEARDSASNQSNLSGTGDSTSKSAGPGKNTGNLINKVEWLALVGAEMSQPLHTCRVEVHFAHGECTDNPCSETICRHKKWLSKVWANRSDTKEFLNTVAKEYSATIV